MIVFLDKAGETDGLCTGTAIGPHAILTAEHCNDGAVLNDTVLFDLSTRKYHLLAQNKDGRDHVIYLLDGPAFTNYLPEDELVNIKPAQPGERVFVYGDGLGQYPPRRVDGAVDNASVTADLSDVDQLQQTVWYTMVIVPGDSGSAIYGSDNRVVGLVTYGFDSACRRCGSKRAVGFGLAFSPDVIHVAHVFALPEAQNNPKHEAS